MKTTSSRQTSKVLQMRIKLEKEIINLQQKIYDGMPKINELEREEETFSILAEAILTNMHFEYEVEETQTEQIDLSGKNQYALTCLYCNYVCHEDCSRAEGEDKANCSSMDTSGNCSRCPNRCKWNAHRSSSYIIKYTTKKVKKINEYMAKKYEEASQKY
ncbi:unnamed protein product [Mytilus edulis]|uniref:Uncharacterized protein n=1 Tax=Mytilus edulis TaxID=6550 RepID=A0A8S3REN8_MYTED|nr:unnamed protein product [Mytilus edulis]